MKKRALKLASLCLTAGILFAGTAPATVYAEEETGTSSLAEEDLTGQLAFAQCEEYINIRSGADTDSEVTAKIYNNGAAVIIGQTGDWLEIKSGNASGFVKAEYFATGSEAEEIAKKVAYNVAAVHPEELNIRTGPSEDFDTIGVASHAEELEVVDYSGDWMKVALGDDVYGYVNAYYVEYKTYYPMAETLEEEAARLRAEQEARSAETWTDAEASAEDYTWSESDAVEGTWTDNDASDDTWTEETWTETEAYQPEETWTETEAQPEETWTETEAQPEETWTETEAPQLEETWTETEAQPEETWTETEAQPEETWTETEAPQPEETWTETEASSSGTGQSIADYAVQFVGNPYVWGGTSLTSGADCSGFTQSVFANFGIGLARTAADQSYGGTSVSLDSLQAGDLVFYNSTGSIDHVAIYIGGGQIVHAANSNSGIIISSCWYSTPVSARRYW